MLYRSDLRCEKREEKNGLEPETKKAAFFHNGLWSVYYIFYRASYCFYLALLVFALGNMLGGRLLNYWSVHKIIWVGGGISAVGTILSAFMLLATPVPMYLTFGVMQGLGQGMVYTTVVAMTQKWFPHRIDLASGLVVTANGLCGFFLAPLSRILLESGGVSLAILTVGLFPSYTSSIFGLRYAGENYAYVLLGMILAALGAPLLSDLVFSMGGTQEILFLLGMIFSVVAFVCVLFLDRRRKKAVK